MKFFFCWSPFQLFFYNIYIRVVKKNPHIMSQAVIISYHNIYRMINSNFVTMENILLENFACTLTLYWTIFIFQKWKKKNVKSQKIKEKKEKYITYFSNHKSEIYCKINNSSKWCLNFRCFFHYTPLFYFFFVQHTSLFLFFFFCTVHIIIYTFYSLYLLYIVFRFIYETDSRRYWWKILHFNKNQISYHISKAFLNYVS